MRQPAKTPPPETFLPLLSATFYILVAVADEDRHRYANSQDMAARTAAQACIADCPTMRHGHWQQVKSPRVVDCIRAN
jgi:hypothetical protein